jgi:DMSO/TMAO reductase YedYZ heme-binding membrane subunit
VVVAAGVTWWIDAVLLHRVGNGTDHAARLAAVLTYVGVDGWYTLARALGITALIFAYASLLLGLAGPRDSPHLAAIHRQIGVVTVALVAGHAALPFASVFEPYGGWRTSFVPFDQPVSWGIHAASWESFGILAFYLLLVTGPTYYLVHRHERAWAMVHRLTVLVYGLSVAHAILLGTDFIVTGPARVGLLAAQVPVLVLMARNIAPASASSHPTLRWAGTIAVGAASATMAALAVLVATGRYSPGMRL